MIGSRFLAYLGRRADPAPQLPSPTRTICVHVVSRSCCSNRVEIFDAPLRLANRCRNILEGVTTWSRSGEILREGRSAPSELVEDLKILGAPSSRQCLTGVLLEFL